MDQQHVATSLENIPVDKGLNIEVASENVGPKTDVEIEPHSESDARGCAGTGTATAAAAGSTAGLGSEDGMKGATPGSVDMVTDPVQATPAVGTFEPIALHDANTTNPGFKKPVMMFGPRPGFKKVDKKVQDVLAGKADEQKRKSSDQRSAVSHETDKDINVANKNAKQEEPKKERKQIMSSLSPAEQLKQNSICLPYKEPVWGGLCETGDYRFEVLKNGTIIDDVDLQVKSFFVFGRLPSCDVTMEHPSLSRYHAIVQYCAKKNSLHEIGWYLYDLDSTHGTWINKNKVKPREYFRVRVGHVLKFGGSSRLFILQGPSEDQDEEAALSITEMKEQREKQKMEAQVLRQAEMEERERKETILKQDTSCSWGIDMEEAREVDAENPFAVETPVNENLYLEDPKKALRGYFEREGFDIPQYEFIEAGFGKQHCKVELPVDSPTGEPIFAEAVVSGKKKEAVVQCALEACRILDRMGELRKSTHESHKKKARNWADDDYYDSDEDTFLDRTGTIEKKRMERMKKAGKHESAVETYETLVEKLNSIQVEIMSIERQLEKARKDALQQESDEADDLDAYMSSIKSGAMDKSMRMKLKARLFELKQEEQKLTRLVNVAKPASLPQLVKSDVKKVPPSSGSSTAPTAHKPLPMFGKMKGPTGPGPRKVGPVGPPKLEVSAVPESDSVVEEDEESDPDEEPIKQADDAKMKKESDKEAENTTMKKDISPAPVTEMDSSPSMKKSKILYLGKKPELKPSNALKRTLIPGMDKKIEKKKSKPAVEYDESDPDYAVWMPPKDQSGDGKTSLNDKYGY
ncbi:kanadaptin-like [Lineus longissimus]|uniref:kanadaptin-like n=1 Tax=Lineus longissimus TaxID=88925 RepID=UPI002B4D33BF